MATAILSTTAKAEARKKGKKDDEGGDKMEVVKEKEDGKDTAENVEAKDDAAKKEGEEAEGEKKDSDKKKEPSFTALANPARCTFLFSSVWRIVCVTGYEAEGESEHISKAKLVLSFIFY